VQLSQTPATFGSVPDSTEVDDPSIHSLNGPSMTTSISETITTVKR
jgi:hypothetical protein